MSDIDKWSAEQCGVTLLIENVIADTDSNRKLFNGYINGKWTLTDPRCMQVFREKFKINTTVLIDEGGYCGWCSYMFIHVKSIKTFDAYGDTLSEAELACAQAIYEASK